MNSPKRPGTLGNDILTFPKKVNRPAVPLVLALMVGITVGDRIPEPFPSYWPWLIGLLLPTLLILTSFFRVAALWFGSVFLLVTGLSLTTCLSPRFLTPSVPSVLLGDRPQHLTGLIVEEPRCYRDRVRLVVRLTAFQAEDREYPTRGMVLLTVIIPDALSDKTSQGLPQEAEPAPPFPLRKETFLRDEKPSDKKKDPPVFHFLPGDPVRFVCSLRPIEGYDNPGGFDFKRNLARQGIRVRGILEHPDLIVKSGPNQLPFGLKRISSLKRQVNGWIDRQVSFPASSLARAVLTGDQSQIPQEIQEAYARAGVSHLLAFSGLNLSLVAGFSYLLIRRLLSFWERLLLTINVRKWALIATFFPVFGYTLLAGMNPPAIRAFLMVALAILALVLRRYSDLLNSLALAAMILLLVAPDALFGPSFQLSFVSVWAIAFLLPRLWDPGALLRVEPPEPRPGPWRRLGFYLWGTFSLSLICQLATAPLVIWWFHQVSLVGVVSNLLLVPLTGALITPLGLAGLIIAPLSQPLSSLLFTLLDFLVRLSLGLVNFFASSPLAYLTLPRPAWPEIASFYLFLTLIFHLRRSVLKTLGIPLAAGLTVFFYFLPHFQDAFQRPLRVHFLDVGRGSSVLVEFPKGKKMLIDGGGSFNPDYDFGERVVAPFLWSRKISRLDVVVLTHPHPDHLNGLPYLLDRFSVKEIWTNGVKTDSESFIRFQEIIRKKQIPLLCPPSGFTRTFADTRVDVILSPCGFTQGTQTATLWSVQNNDSLVLTISRGSNRILLPADLEIDGEKRLIGQGGRIQSRILQVPHHGSRTSSSEEFLRAVNPTWAIVSARSTPLSSLPHPEVVKRYQRLGIHVLRTDQEGLITFVLGSERGKVESRRRGQIAAF